MKNRMKIIVIIVILLLVGYVVSKHFNKKESNQEEITVIEEQPKEKTIIIETKADEKESGKTEKNTKKSKKSPSKVTKKKTSKKKVVKKTQKVPSYNKNSLKAYAHNLVMRYGWTEYDYECLIKLWNRESGWRPNAVNKKSGACGIPQSLPCKKMRKEGSDYKTNGKTQIRWGLKYIKSRYGSPSKAWKHSQRKWGM